MWNTNRSSQTVCYSTQQLWKCVLLCIEQRGTGPKHRGGEATVRDTALVSKAKVSSPSPSTGWSWPRDFRWELSLARLGCSSNAPLRPGWAIPSTLPHSTTEEYCAMKTRQASKKPRLPSDLHFTLHFKKANAYLYPIHTEGETKEKWEYSW